MLGACVACLPTCETCKKHGHCLIDAVLVLAVDRPGLPQAEKLITVAVCSVHYDSDPVGDRRIVHPAVRDKVLAAEYAKRRREFIYAKWDESEREQKLGELLTYVTGRCLT
jgi:hypothetical protein